MSTNATHEHLKPADDVKVGSERAFGIVFAVVFVIIGLAPLLYDGPLRIWSLGVCAGFLGAAFILPSALKPLNLVWFKFGLLLHKVVNPLIMGLMFFVVITPIGLLMRATGKDPLARKLDLAAKTYWIPRDAEKAGTMKNQF